MIGELFRPQSRQLLDAALSWSAEAPVFPAAPGGDARLAPSTQDRATIERLWAEHPNANVGVEAGHSFDVLVVTGERSLKRLADEHGDDLGWLISAPSTDAQRRRAKWEQWERSLDGPVPLSTPWKLPVDRVPFDVFRSPGVGRLYIPVRMSDDGRRFSSENLFPGVALLTTGRSLLVPPSYSERHGGQFMDVTSRKGNYPNLPDYLADAFRAAPHPHRENGVRMWPVGRAPSDARTGRNGGSRDACCEQLNRKVVNPALAAVRMAEDRMAELLRQVPFIACIVVGGCLGRGRFEAFGEAVGPGTDLERFLAVAVPVRCPWCSLRRWPSLPVDHYTPQGTAPPLDL